MAIIQVIKNKLPHARTLVLVGFVPNTFLKKGSATSSAISQLR